MISVVICNYNRREILLECLENIFKTPLNMSVCVVDNGSTDESTNAIEQRFGSHIKLIKNTENTGVGGGFFTGLQNLLKENEKTSFLNETESKTTEFQNANWIVILDSDCLVNKNTIPELINFLKNNPEFGVAGPKLYGKKDDFIIPRVGRKIDWSTALRFSIHDYWNEKKQGNFEETLEVDFVPAACLVLRESVIQKCGLIDPEYFMYFDDIDWCNRIKNSGFKIAYHAKSSAVHFGEYKTEPDGKDNYEWLKRYYVTRNRVHFFLNNTPEKFYMQMLNSIEKETAQNLAVCQFFNQEQTLEACKRGFSDAIKSVRGKYQGPSLHNLVNQQLRENNDWQTFYIKSVPHMIWGLNEDLKNAEINFTDSESHKLSAQTLWQNRNAFNELYEDVLKTIHKQLAPFAANL